METNNTLTADTITQRQASDAWEAGNRAGNGYGAYRDVPGDDTVEAAIEAAIEDGATLILDRANQGEVAVLEMSDGALVAIGDSHGAWAVVLRD